MLRLLNRSNACPRLLLGSHGRIGRDGSVQPTFIVAHGGGRCALQAPQKHWASSHSVAPQSSPLIHANTSETSTQKDKAHDDVHLPIRKSLRSWVRQHDQDYLDSIPQDSFIFGSVANNLTRSQSTGSSEFDQIRATRGGVTDDPEGEEAEGDSEAAIVGVGHRKVGDLVEIRASGSRVPLFAIYLGFFGDRNHMYAANGRWITSRGFSSSFTISSFATPAELAPLLRAIPRNASPEDFDELRREDRGPSREDGAKLIEKMNDLRSKAELIFQTHIEQLDAIRLLLSNQKQTEYLTLEDIAKKLLPASLKDETLWEPALYAVHLALLQSEIGFRLLNPTGDCRRKNNLIEIFPQKDANIIEDVATMVREYTRARAKHMRPPTPKELEETLLGKFILKARKAVTASRSKREWSPHGILKPSSGISLPRTQWSKKDEEIIDFLEWWATHDIFEAGSRFHGHGALILRALGVYDEDTALSQSTAWTFLQEVGHINPWELPSRYKVRFPGTKFKKGEGLERETPQVIEESTRPDIASGCRRPHNEATIFCIDGPSTIVVDDGVSLERTNKPDEFWLHIHAADPASCIAPDSELGKFMELVPENIYLPGHFEAMLPSDVGSVSLPGHSQASLPSELGDEDSVDLEHTALSKQFSLRSGSPALTFSAKVNEAGDVLDLKVEPSKLGNVVYVDPADVAQFCNEPAPPPPPTHSLSVGTPLETSSTPNRDIKATKDLDASSKEDLRTMYRLAEAVRKKRLAKGAWPYFFPRPSVSVDFPQEGKPEKDSPVHVVPADPHIKVSYEASTACSVVSNLMVLAGEVAARWCSARGIPVPYRRDVRPAQSTKGAYEYATKTVYPLIEQGIEPSLEHRAELSRLTGGIEMSPHPGSYFLLGLDMYAKATSPLRRFSDLLVHWQIHAALRHERLTQRPLDPNVDDLDKILPFPEEKLKSTISLLQMREKMARKVSRGLVDWILIALVRAWRFEKSAPTSLRFTVGSRFKQGFLGRIDLFGLNAVMDVQGLDGRALIKDVQVGDKFDVELADVNVHSRQIMVKALKHLGAEQPKS